jgi:predicted tellurium resistance membrane protein TerC
MNFSTHGKSLTAFAYALAVAFLPQLNDGWHTPTPVEGVAIAIAVTTAAMTYLVPLVPRAPGIKTAVAAVLTALQVAATLVVDGWPDATGIMLIAAAFLGALGIAVAPAASTSGVAVGWGSDSRTA